MGYEFEPGDARIDKAVRRIARAELGAAIALAQAPTHDGSPIHTLRRHIKKTRGLLRLVAPVFPAFKHENAALREAAALISGLRDAEVMREGLERIALNAGAPGASAQKMLAALPRPNEAIDPQALATFAGQLEKVRERARNWDLEERGWDALAPGLEQTLHEARKRMHRTRRSLKDADFHAWRSRVKHHWYHTRLLNPLWPEMMTARALAADRLGETLGLHHDLAVLRAALPDHLDEHEASALARHLDAEQTHLEAQAFALGARLFAERPEAVSDRWGEWHALWRADVTALN